MQAAQDTPPFFYVFWADCFFIISWEGSIIFIQKAEESIFLPLHNTVK